MYQIKSLHSLDSPGVLHNQSKVTHSLVFTGVGYFFLNTMLIQTHFVQIYLNTIRRKRFSMNKRLTDLIQFSAEF